MAKPIEIAFTAIRNHKSIRALNATARGAYMALVQACLLDGFDPLPTDKSSLQVLSSADHNQWGKIEKRVHTALNETLSILKTHYERKLFQQEQKRINALLSTEKRLLTLRAESFTKCEATEFIEQNDSPSVILQPFKATNFRSNKVDLNARSQAIKAKSDNQGKLKPLTD